MDRERQAAMAETFGARQCSQSILLLPDVWDPMSARLFAAGGLDVLATIGAGIAWALGYPDSEAAPWEEVLAGTAHVVRSADMPMTTDIEGGYGDMPAKFDAYGAAVIQADGVGFNLEDRLRGPLSSMKDATARLSSVREAANREGVPIVLNARCKNYFAAGADCVYPTGLRGPATIAASVRVIGGPINITALPGIPDTGKPGAHRCGANHAGVGSRTGGHIVDPDAHCPTAGRRNSRAAGPRGSVMSTRKRCSKSAEHDKAATRVEAPPPRENISGRM